MKQKLIAEHPSLEDVFDAEEEEDTIYAFHRETGFEELIRSVVKESQNEYYITGTGIQFTTGTTYLVKNLFISLAIAIFVIAILMSLLFRSWRMVLSIAATQFSSSNNNSCYYGVCWYPN